MMKEMLERKAHFDTYHGFHPPFCTATNVLYTIKTKHIIRKIIALTFITTLKNFLNECKDTLNLPSHICVERIEH